MCTVLHIQEKSVKQFLLLQGGYLFGCACWSVCLSAFTISPENNEQIFTEQIHIIQVAVKLQ